MRITQTGETAVMHNVSGSRVELDMLDVAWFFAMYYDMQTMRRARETFRWARARRTFTDSATDCGLTADEAGRLARWYGDNVYRP